MPSQKTIARWHEQIEDNGSARVKLRQLLDHFGYSRRGTAVIEEIASSLADEDPKIYVDGLDDMTLGLDDRVSLTHSEIERVGNIWRGSPDEGKRRGRRGKRRSRRGPERAFKMKHGNQMLTRKPLSLVVVDDEYRPRGTRDAFDYLCEDRRGWGVVVEVKVGDGERRAVEQLLRYIHQLRKEAKYPKGVRGVLVTGVADPSTKEALATLDPWKLIKWYVYGLDDGGRLLPLRPIDVKRHADPNG